MSTIYLANSLLVPEDGNILEHGADAPASPTLQHPRNVVVGLPQLAKFAGTACSAVLWPAQAVVHAGTQS
jgi:hypothetical protein